MTRPELHHKDEPDHDADAMRAVEENIFHRSGPKRFNSVQSHDAAVLSAPAGSAPEAISATNQPETANKMVGGFPVAAAPFHAEETGGCDPENIAGDGRDVEAAGGAASVVTNSKKHPLRPLCLHPYEEICGGWSDHHCTACLSAAS